MIDGALLVVARLVVDDAQVDVGEELACHVGHLFVPRVVVNGVSVVVRLRLAQLHVVHADAVVCKRLTMHVANRLAHLEELLVGLDSLFEFAQVVKQNSS